MTAFSVVLFVAGNVCGPRITASGRMPMRPLILSALFALALATPSMADDCYTWKKVVCHETVVCYENRCETYCKLCTVYDECGKPYTVRKTFIRTIRVPVEKTVAVVKYVKVYH